MKLFHVVLLLFLVGCSSANNGVDLSIANPVTEESATFVEVALPRDGQEALNWDITNTVGRTDYIIASSQQGISADFGLPNDEIWCVVISPPLIDNGAEISHFLLYRLGNRWNIGMVEFRPDLFSMVGCDNWDAVPEPVVQNSLPQGAVDALNADMQQQRAVGDYTISSSQEGNPDNMQGGFDEIWCITISPPVMVYGMETSHYLIYRRGSHWAGGAIDGFPQGFSDIGCTNWND